MEVSGTIYFDLPYEQKVFEQMNGYYETQEVPGVRDESRDGFVRTYIDALYGARDRLCSRFSIPEGDSDMEAMLDASEGLSRACGLALFRYGSQRAAEQKP